MHSVNHNSEISNFSNYLKKEPVNSLNFNDYQYENPNSHSLNFAYFNQFPQTSNPLDRVEPEVKLEENPDIKEQTIGFNQLHGILQNSMKYTFDQFKNAKIKKTPTFQHTQGYLNACHQQTDLCKQEPQKNTSGRK